MIRILYELPPFLAAFPTPYERSFHLPDKLFAFPPLCPSLFLDGHVPLSCHCDNPLTNQVTISQRVAALSSQALG